MITVIKQGDFTTVQDEGRLGYQAWGMPVAGAMDRYACRMANLLAGNNKIAAVVEMTGEGAAFKFDEEQLVAVCGADMQGTVNGMPVESWSAFLVPARGELRFDAAIAGYRTYLAVRGGIDVPVVLGSRSTYTGAKIGGYGGRTLRAGDVLHVGQDSEAEAAFSKLPVEYIPQYGAQYNLRMILGPQDHLFSPEAIHTFLTGIYTVAGSSNRVNYQLVGPKINSLVKMNIVSDAISLGAVQIPSYGMPHIAAADHGTIRGFAKIGYVIQVDLAKLAQAKPGNSVCFTHVTEQEAVDALKEEQQCYKKIARTRCSSSPEC